jgi:hypothetical protein
MNKIKTYLTNKDPGNIRRPFKSIGEIRNVTMNEVFYYCPTISFGFYRNFYLEVKKIK